MLWLIGGRLATDGGCVVGNLAIQADRFAAMGKGRHGRGVDLTGALILPGLVNGHDHLHLNAFGRVAPRRLYRNSYDWAAEMTKRLDTEPIRVLRLVPQAARAWHGALKNILAGATTVVHHDPWLDVFDRPDFPVTVPPIGWAHSLGLAGVYGPALAESRRGTPPGRPWYLHLAEGTDVAAERELGQLARHVPLDREVRLVHGVGLTPADAERAVAAGVGLVWCPASNDYLMSRVADPRPFLAAGKMALGTDSRLTGARDLLAELAAAAATGLAAPDALLRAITTDGARLCGRPAAGRLAVGASADLVVLPDDGRSPAEQLVAARRGDLRLVMTRGRPAVADPDLATVFDWLAEPAVSATLDGRPKLVARRLLAPVLASGLSEPGLEVVADVAYGWQGEIGQEAVVA